MIGSAERAESQASDERHRYLAHTEVAIGPRERLVVGGILRPDTTADLEPDVQVDALLPHDAGLVLERAEPDLVIVESRAVAAGNPWAGAGEPGIADVALRLLGVLDGARALGRPSVLWWSGPRHATPGLIPFESRFDLVVASDPGPGVAASAWTPGLQLARFDPIGGDPDRSVRPVAHVRWDEAPSRSARSFMEGALAGLATEEPELWIDADAVVGATWLPDRLRSAGLRRVAHEALAELYRARGLFLADPLTVSPGMRPIATGTLRQLASGARVVSGPNESLAESLGEWIEWAPDARQVRDAVRSGAGLGPRTTADIRRLLGALFLRHDTTGAVGALARMLGIRRATPRRDCCAVARFDAHTRPEAFLDAVVLQRHRPTEAIIAADDPADAAIALWELERLGIPVRSVPPPGAERGVARWAASHTSAAWLWVWSPGFENDPAYLIDALTAGLMTGASAIGCVPGASDGFCDGSQLKGPVVSRAAAARLPDMGSVWTRSWKDRGATFYGIATDPDGR